MISWGKIRNHVGLQRNGGWKLIERGHAYSTKLHSNKKHHIQDSSKAFGFISFLDYPVHNNLSKLIKKTQQVR